MYKRQKRNKPNKVYTTVNKDEVIFYFDILNDNSINNISNITGFGRDFVRKTLSK